MMAVMAKIRQCAGDDAFDTAVAIDVDVDFLAGSARTNGAEGNFSGRNVDDLAGMLGTILKHETAIYLHAYALEVAQLRT